MTSAGAVLFIDDERPIRMASGQALELAGFDVTAVESAGRGLKHVSRDFPGCVVSDVRMPGMDGLELLAAVRAVDP
ncbi:response regulator, partial [Azospirillum sp.]|uniref:response regulator n=1 Tax=Azospirillum sp. TaxID=34012 RepID=UPI002D53505B